MPFDFRRLAAAGVGASQPNGQPPPQQPIPGYQRALLGGLRGLNDPNQPQGQPPPGPAPIQLAGLGGGVHPAFNPNTQAPPPTSVSPMNVAPPMAGPPPAPNPMPPVRPVDPNDPYGLNSRNRTLGYY